MRAVVAIDPAGRVFRVYARVAATAFALVVLYTLVAKLPGGELARDWTHTALHVVSGCAGVYAGWITDRATPAKAFTATLALAYGTLGLFGWFIDGLLWGQRFESRFRRPTTSSPRPRRCGRAHGRGGGVVACRAPIARRPRERKRERRAERRERLR